MRVEEENEKTGLKLNMKKTKIMASGSITSWQIEGTPPAQRWSCSAHNASQVVTPLQGMLMGAAVSTGQSPREDWLGMLGRS